MFVRLICRAQPAKTPAELGFWPRLAYRYAMALKEAGIPVRIVSVALAQYGKGTAWYDLEGPTDGGYHAFTRNVPDDFVNVVCEVPRVAARMWTLGRWNIAIAAVEHQIPEDKKADPGVRAMFDDYNRYDYVCAPGEGARALLEQVGVSVDDVIPGFTGLVSNIGWASFAKNLAVMVSRSSGPKAEPPVVDNAALEKMFDAQEDEAKRAIDHLTKTARGMR